MKKIILFFALVIISTGCTFAQEKTMEVRNFQTAVKNFLAQEGYVPKIDGDGDLTFKKEGNVFWYIIQQNSDDKLFFVTLGRDPIGASGEDIDMLAVYQAVNKINQKLRCGKAYYLNGKIRYSLEFYARTPNDVTAFFNDHMVVMDIIENRVKEYYSEFHEGHSK